MNRVCSVTSCVPWIHLRLSTNMNCNQKVCYVIQIFLRFQNLNQPLNHVFGIWYMESSRKVVHRFFVMKLLLLFIESMQTTSMETVGTGVLDKNKEDYLRSQDKAEKAYDVSRHIPLHMWKYFYFRVFLIFRNVVFCKKKFDSCHRTVYIPRLHGSLLFLVAFVVGGLSGAAYHKRYCVTL